MSDIVMGKPKKVGDNGMVTELEEEGMLVLGKPTVAKNPMTGKLERIIDVVKVPNESTCPKCQALNKPGVEITILESGLIIYACPTCGQFIWCREKR